MDALEEGRDLLAEQYRGKPNFDKVIQVFARQFQELEVAAHQLIDNRSVGTAEGATLGVLERIVGQRQFVFTDNEVRRAWIRARILLNRCSGTGDEVLRILAAVLPVGTFLQFVEEFPAAFRIAASGALDETLAEQVGRMVQLGKAAGVGAQFHWQPDADADTFTYPNIVITLAEDLFGGELNFDATVWAGTPPSGVDPSLVTAFTIGNADNLETFTGYDGFTPGSPGNFSIDGFGQIVNVHLIGEQITIYGPADVGAGYGDAGDPDVGGSYAGAF